ncbi:MAG: phage tail protein [Acidobacteria bacterium]|nr:phage tail protein [Acidobacteriota bacterium]
MNEQLLHTFRFWVEFKTDPLAGASGGGQDVALCGGAFSECTGLDATMEPKVIKEGGRNHGPHQRVGPVTYSTVILKRGLTNSKDLWTWFELVGGGGYAYRLAVTITLFNPAGEGVFSWKLDRALPVKFKAADLNARSTEVGIEELHLAHEGLSRLSAPARQKIPNAS